MGTEEHNAHGRHHVMWNGAENELVPCGSPEAHRLAALALQLRDIYPREPLAERIKMMSRTPGTRMTRVASRLLIESEGPADLARLRERIDWACQIVRAEATWLAEDIVIFRSKHPKPSTT
jgi:hypothetical protein